MSSFLDKLNLRPQEQRLVVFVGLLVFVALNLLLVYPQFGKVTFWQNRKQASEAKLETYKNEVARLPEYRAKLQALQEAGTVIGTEEAILSLSKDVASMAGTSGVAVESYNPLPKYGPTNAFFDEAGLRITVRTGEKELVDFLYKLGAQNVLIRVRSINLQPDPGQTMLRGTIELVESFPKKSLPKASGSSHAPGPKPGTPIAKKTAVSGTNLVAKASAAGKNKPAASGNWFSRLLARFTGRSKPVATKTNAPAKAPAPSVAVNLKTNTTRPIPLPPRPK